MSTLDLERDYQKDPEKIKCVECGFIFFTRYTSRIISKQCSTCDPENENNLVVRDWEK